MSFEAAASETRERLAEALSLLNHLASTAPKDLAAANDVEKAMRGLWLVSIYGAFERSINATVEQAIHEITSHQSPSLNCKPPIHSIFYYSQVQSLKDCGYSSVFDKASEIMVKVLSNEPIAQTENPLANMLQNVGANTLELVIKFFGAPVLEIGKANAGRLNALRERRNAVAHGRESAAQVGERYRVEELRKLYEVVDYELARFQLHMKEFCEKKMYIRRAA
ncbi:MAE_28990/MAE_18760 family HEPN-like nuclease [Aminobacter sp. P9b]|uniref:HEPN domain-containing protein n=1 Tax=Aminobacter sp. P9b TaxID=3133697 RepID=UPI00325124C0